MGSRLLVVVPIKTTTFLIPGLILTGVVRGMGKEYRCVAASLTGFIQQVAVSYVRYGYWFYVMGSVRESKDVAKVDQKFTEIYGLSVSKFVRCRRRKTGVAGMQYIRLGRFFLLLATHGEHLFFVRERGMIRDVRRSPIRVGGYAIGFRNGRVSVRIDRTEYRFLKKAFEERALDRKERLEAEFNSLPYEPYAPVRSQILVILRAVNRRRALAGLRSIDRECVRTMRRIVRPFAEVQT